MTAGQGGVHNRKSIVELMRQLIDEYRGSSDATWENRTLESYLEALAAWLEDCDGYYENRGRSVPDNGWEILADGLQAAKSYE